MPESTQKRLAAALKAPVHTCRGCKGDATTHEKAAVAILAADPSLAADLELGARIRNENDLPDLLDERDRLLAAARKAERAFAAYYGADDENTPKWDRLVERMQRLRAAIEKARTA